MQGVGRSCTRAADCVLHAFSSVTTWQSLDRQSLDVAWGGVNRLVDRRPWPMWYVPGSKTPITGGNVSPEPRRGERFSSLASSWPASSAAGFLSSSSTWWRHHTGTPVSTCVYLVTSLAGSRLPKPPEMLFAVFFWLGYCNSALNPIIYTIFNRDFRRAFQKILCGRPTVRYWLTTRHTANSFPYFNCDK